MDTSGRHKQEAELFEEMKQISAVVVSTEKRRELDLRHLKRTGENIISNVVIGIFTNLRYCFSPAAS